MSTTSATTATLDRPRRSPVRPLRAPLRRPWQPKPYEPGTVVDYVDAAGTVRVGEVWSAGPVPASVWVLPAHTPRRPAAVKVHRSKTGGPPAGQELPAYGPGWQRDTVRRCDAVRAAGRVFRCVDAEPGQRWPGDPGRYSYHVQGCPVAGSQREYLTHSPTYGPTTVSTGPVAWLVDTLLHGPEAMRPYFCRTCIYLTEEG